MTTKSISLLLLAPTMILAACGNSTPAGAPSQSASPSPSITASPSESPTSSPSPSPSSSPSPSPTPSRAPQTFTETETADGTTLDVIVGDKIIIKLQANESTGYSWRYSHQPSASVVQATRSAYSPTPHPATQVGSGGYQYYDYDVVGSGSTYVGLKYEGPGGSVAKTYTLHVRSS